MPPPKPKRVRKVLLAATVGLATLTLGGCGGMTSGNLIAPPEIDAGTDAGQDAAPDAAAPDEDAGE